MLSNYESFFQGNKFAVIGNSKKMKFPILTYRGLKILSKTVFPIDEGSDEIDGDRAYKDLNELPEKVDRAILEVKKDEISDWMKKIIDSGIKDVWVHMGCDTPEAIKLAEDNNINLRTGTCAVMYVTPGPSYHSIHKWVMKILKKY